MKILAGFVVLFLLMGGICMGETLTKVESLTLDEKIKLSEAGKKVHAAEVELTKIRNEIAANHKMSSESYMEWHTRYDINGDFILFYYSHFSDIHIQ